jgi:tRNA U34 5-methylaminomethyl-2-thiouridine-forming methyltransferase MnmC
MERKIIITADGSHSIFIPSMDENYHSVHGAIGESMHVFINAGLHQCKHQHLRIFEVGFGTGLNALLTLIEASKSKISVHYTGIEKYPLTSEEYLTLNYPEIIGEDYKESFIKMHTCEWGKDEKINNNFIIKKINADLTHYEFDEDCIFDLVYFDAFAPNKQPDLWNTDIYRKIYNNCSEGAILVTYCAKGIVRRELVSAGFTAERLPGPPGKFEMLRAIKR